MITIVRSLAAATMLVLFVSSACSDERQSETVRNGQFDSDRSNSFDKKGSRPKVHERGVNRSQDQRPRTLMIADFEQEEDLQAFETTAVAISRTGSRFPSTFRGNLG